MKYITNWAKLNTYVYVSETSVREKENFRQKSTDFMLRVKNPKSYPWETQLEDPNDHIITTIQKLDTFVKKYTRHDV